MNADVLILRKCHPCHLLATPRSEAATNDAWSQSQLKSKFDFRCITMLMHDMSLYILYKDDWMSVYGIDTYGDS